MDLLHDWTHTVLPRIVSDGRLKQRIFESFPTDIPAFILNLNVGEQQYSSLIMQF